MVSQFLSQKILYDMTIKVSLGQIYIHRIVLEKFDNWFFFAWNFLKSVDILIPGYLVFYWRFIEILIYNFTLHICRIFFNVFWIFLNHIFLSFLTKFTLKIHTIKSFAIICFSLRKSAVIEYQKRHHGAKIIEIFFEKSHIFATK